MICKKCGLEKNEVEFPQDKTRKNGLHPYCKSCKAAEQKKREKKKRENKYNEMIASEYRLCWTCKEIKHRSEFEEKVFFRRIGYISCKSCLQKTLELRKEKKEMRKENGR